MTLELERLLSSGTYERLQAKAERENVTLEAVVVEVLEGYVEDLDDDGEDVEIENTPDEVILENFRRGWDDVMNGRTTPADEAIAKIQAKYGRKG